MKLLIDSHIFLWLLFSPEKISANTLSLIQSRQNTVYISSVTFWELSLKYGLGKISFSGVLPEELPVWAKKLGLDVLVLDAETASSIHQLPKYHNDPFDRMIIHTAIQNQLTLISRDRAFATYLNDGLIGLLH